METADLLFYASANVPSADTGTTGGAIDTGAPIVGSLVGELLPKAIYDIEGGADSVWYYAFFVKNEHATETLYNGKFWVPNLLALIGTAGALSVVSDSASDDATSSVVCHGISPTGSSQTSTTPLNGTTPVVPAGNWADLRKVEITATSGGGAKDAVGNITITRGTDLGIVPAPESLGATSVSFDTAEAEYEFGLGAVNGTLSAATRLVAPAGIVFSRPATEGGALSFPANLPPGDALQIWIKATAVAATPRTTRTRVVPLIAGNS